MPARDAYARQLAAQPAPPLPPARAGRPAVLPLDPPPGSGLRRDDLVALAADAAARCWELATGAGDGGLGLDAEADLARRAAAALGRPEFTALAGAAGVPSRALARDAIAWRHGGPGGLDAVHNSWQPEADELAEGRAALDALDAPTPTHSWRNRLTRGTLQLRLGRDGRWYRLSRSGTSWDLDGSPHADPSTLLAERS